MSENEVASEVTEENTITLIETAIAVGKVIDGKEDFVYKKPPESLGTCVYSDPKGNPSCIVGCAFDELGVDRPRWADHENKSSFGNLPQSHLFTNSAQTFLRHLQSEQDRYVPWGIAVKYAAEIVKGSCE